MSVNSQVILLAIQATVRLEGQIRQIQIDKIRETRLNLLVPKFGRVNFKSAVRWFVRDGARTIANNAALIELVDRAERDFPSLTQMEKQRLIDEYIQRRNVADRKVILKIPRGLSHDNIYAISNVAQWSTSASNYPSPLQRICGSLIDLGVDYFKSNPHLCNENTPQGKMLMAFLDAVDEVDFAEGHLKDITNKMMVATIDTLDVGTAFISGDSNASLLIKGVAKGILTDVNNFIKKEGIGKLVQQEQARLWGQLIFKSVLNTAGETVLENPHRFFAVGEDASEMVTAVGKSLLSSVLEDVDAGAGVVVSLKNVLTSETLNKVTRAGFSVLAEHPEWYNIDNQGLKNILMALLKEVAHYPNQLGLDMLPDLATLILRQMSNNLQLIYQGDPSSPANNLLITATGLVLKTLQQAVPTAAGQQWQPIFTKSQTIALIDGILQEVVNKPDWVLAKVGASSTMLEDVLSAVFQSFRGVSVGNISTDAQMSIAKAAISAVALRQDLLDRFNIDGKEITVLNYGIEMVLDLAFDQKADARVKWALANSNAIELLTDAVLNRIAKEGASAEVVTLTKTFIESEIAALTDGKPFDIPTVVAKLKSGDTLQRLLQNTANTATRISASLISSYEGQLGINNQGIRNIVAHLADFLKDYPDDVSGGMLLELATLVLDQMSNNLPLIYQGDPNNPTDNLIIKTTGLVLKEIKRAVPTAAGQQWQPIFTKSQTIALIDGILQEVVNKPDWVLAKVGASSTMLEDVLSAVFQSFRGVSVGNISTDAQMSIAKAAISAVALRQDLLDRFNIDGKEITVLNYGIEMVLDLAFDQKADARVKWALANSNAIELLTDAVLNRIAKEGASAEVVTLTKTFIESEIAALTDGKPFDIPTVVAKLKSGDTLQNLLRNTADAATRIAATLIADYKDQLNIDNQGIKNIVVHLADFLKDYPADIAKGMLPDLATMVLLDTSANLDVITNNNNDPGKNLLVLASQTVLQTLAEQDANGKLAFRFNAEQVLYLLTDIFEKVINKPQWIITKAQDVDPLLATALKAALDALNGARLLSLSNDVKIDILRSALKAVATDRGFMDKIGVKHEFVMTATLDIIFRAAKGEIDTTNLSADVTELITEKVIEKIEWALSDNTTLERLSDAVLQRVAREGASEATIQQANQLVVLNVVRVAKGEPFSVADLVQQLGSEEKLADLIADLA